MAEINFLISHKTAKNEFLIKINQKLVPTKDFVVHKDVFDNLCLQGCKNYNMKYVCPPHSPSFNSYKQKYPYALVVSMIVDMNRYDKIYNTTRMVNVVTKSKLRKLFDGIGKYLTQNEISYFMLENGACRLCKKCNLQIDQPCKHPDKMRYSLESTGVDVNKLVEHCFNFSLEWYTKHSFPQKQGVVSAILLKKPVSLDLTDFLAD